jgi:hypothetical protein
MHRVRRGEGSIPVPVVLLRLVVLRRVLGFCAMPLVISPVVLLERRKRTGHGDGCGCRFGCVVCLVEELRPRSTKSMWYKRGQNHASVLAPLAAHP